MQLVKQIHVPKNHPLFKECDRICFASKNLYNQALWRIKNHWETNKQYLDYYAINRQMVSENQVDYRALASCCSQQTLMMLNRNHLNFFNALREFKKNPSKFTGPPKEPRFLNKVSGRYVATFTSNIILRKPLKKGFLGLAHTTIQLPCNFTWKQIHQVRIVPKNDLYIIEIIYEKDPEPDIISDTVCGIDLGLNNLATLGFNDKSVKPIIINGRSLKSINQFYNKKKAQLQSKLTKTKTKSSKRIRKLTQKRNNKIKEGLHQASKIIAETLKHNNVSSVVIGLNKQWKTDISIGKRNNQNFVSIPHSRLVEMITYKCKLRGIKVLTREESYTSKCSFKDQETIRKHMTYQGKRVKRGLFQSKEGMRYNADLNGALNILKKEFPNGFANGIEGLLVSPRKIEIYS